MKAFLWKGFLYGLWLGALPLITAHLVAWSILDGTRFLPLEWFLLPIAFGALSALMGLLYWSILTHE